MLPICERLCSYIISGRCSIGHITDTSGCLEDRHLVSGRGGVFNGSSTVEDHRRSAQDSIGGVSSTSFEDHTTTHMGE